MKCININFCDRTAAALYSLYWMPILTGESSSRGFLFGFLFTCIPSKLSYLSKRSTMSHTRDNAMRYKPSPKLRFRGSTRDKVGFTLKIFTYFYCDKKIDVVNLTVFQFPPSRDIFFLFSIHKINSIILNRNIVGESKSIYNHFYLFLLQLLSS